VVIAVAAARGGVGAVVVLIHYIPSITFHQIYFIRYIPSIIFHPLHPIDQIPSVISN
jgi:hypothetical protein